MFGTLGLVFCPCGPSREVLCDFAEQNAIVLDPITNEFTPTGEQVTIWETHDASNPDKITAAAKTLNVKREFEVIDCYSIISNFGIDSDIYNSLVQRNSQLKLIFPTQILTFSTMSKKLNPGHSTLPLFSPSDHL